MCATDFSVLPMPGTPVVVAPGDSIEFTIQYLPIGAGVQAAIIRIVSNDLGAPNVDVAVIGTKGTSGIATSIASNGNFGNVCVGSFADEILTINNPGHCPLLIFDITATPAEFEAPHVAPYPLVIAPGDSIDPVVRFRPVAFGTVSGTFTIISNAPGSPSTVFVVGTAPLPRLALIISNSGTFGKVCIGSLRDEPLILANSGKCLLTVTGMSPTEFAVPSVLSWPVRRPLSLWAVGRNPILLLRAPYSTEPLTVKLIQQPGRRALRSQYSKPVGPQKKSGNHGIFVLLASPTGFEPVLSP